MEKETRGDNVHNLFEKRASKKAEMQSPLEIDFNSDKISRMKQALDDKIFLLGDVYRDAHGIHADWSHFDFMMAVYGDKIVQAPNNLIAHKMFWGYLWEYISPLLKSYENLSASFQNMIEDTDAIIVNHAELRIKTDLQEAWIKTLPKSLQDQYENYFNRENKKINVKLERIKNDEEFKASEEQRIRDESPKNRGK